MATIVQDNDNERRLLDDQQLEACLDKCVHAADEILAIAEQFTDDDIKYRDSPTRSRCSLLGQCKYQRGAVILYVEYASNIATS